jgi:hypothetical protein
MLIIQGLGVHVGTAGAHRADGADVFVACEDVVLDEPEADVSKTLWFRVL